MEKYFNEWILQAIKSRAHLDSYLKAADEIAEENKELLMQLWDNHHKVVEATIEVVEKTTGHSLSGYESTKKKSKKKKD